MPLITGLLQVIHEITGSLRVIHEITGSLQVINEITSGHEALRVIHEKPQRGWYSVTFTVVSVFIWFGSYLGQNVSNHPSRLEVPIGGHAREAVLLWQQEACRLLVSLKYAKRVVRMRSYTMGPNSFDMGDRFVIIFFDVLSAFLQNPIQSEDRETQAFANDRVDRLMQPTLNE